MAKPAKDPKADAEFKAAHKLFEQGKFAEAEKGIRQDRQGPQGHSLGRRQPVLSRRDPVSAQKYVEAHDSFEMLHKDYPATDYLDKLVSREYAIAQLWFTQDDPKAPKDKLLPWYGRFDGRLPIIDVQGSALKALEHVRQNDPTARWPTTPRSRSPNIYMKHHDYDSAAIYYDQFIARIPQEPLPPGGPARGDRRPAERLPGPRLRRVRPGESTRAGQEDHGRPFPNSRQVTRGSITRST